MEEILDDLRILGVHIDYEIWNLKNLHHIGHKRNPFSRNVWPRYGHLKSLQWRHGDIASHAANVAWSKVNPVELDLSKLPVLKFPSRSAKKWRKRKQYKEKLQQKDDQEKQKCSLKNTRKNQLQSTPDFNESLIKTKKPVKEKQSSVSKLRLNLDRLPMPGKQKRRKAEIEMENSKTFLKYEDEPVNQLKMTTKTQRKVDGNAEPVFPHSHQQSVGQVKEKLAAKWGKIECDQCHCSVLFNAARATFTDDTECLRCGDIVSFKAELLDYPVSNCRWIINEICLLQRKETPASMKA